MHGPRMPRGLLAGPEHPHSSHEGNPKRSFGMSQAAQILEFDPYRLDIGRRLLTRDTQAVTL